jgi:hypothetical protein
MSSERNERAGFDHRIRDKETARQRSALALIASAALALSTAVAATVVSMGIARAAMLGGAADGDNRSFAVAGLLGFVLAGMGLLTAMVTRRAPPARSAEKF